VKRAVLILIASLAALLVVNPVASATGAPLREVKFELHEDGFLVTLKSEIGQEKVVLTLYRHREVAYYEVPAELTDDTVKARFGQLGEVDYTFTPTLRAGPCSGFAEGTFEGTFDFTGENEYVSFEVPRARGTFLGSPTKGCKEARRAAGGKQQNAAEDEASLLVHTVGTLPLRSMIIFESAAKHRPRVFFSAFESEEEEGMLIARGAQTLAPRSAFTWNLKAGTAHIDPPAPFTGSATFKRRPGGHSVWRGSLRAPLLGGQPFRLAGSDFQAQLIEGSLLD
jgi:hypothetical protein